MRGRTLAAVLALVVGAASLVAVVLGWQGDTPKPAPTTATSQCAPVAVYLARGKPSPCLTPGRVRTSDPQIICQRGYATKTRQELTSSQWTARRREVLTRYGLAKNPGEIDHLLPLSGGGNNTVDNLWPESAPQFKGKDKAEAGLHAGICKPGVTAEQVQRLQQAFLDQWRG